MVDITVKIRDMYEPLHLPTGERNKVTIVRMEGHILEMEDAHFHHDSAVLLPDAPEGSSDLVDGLTVLQACLLHARDNPSQKLILIGHTDTTGSDAHNLELSRERADNVLFALTGDREAWRNGANSNHRVQDYQHILAWVAATYGWPCDPGAIDDIAGPRTERGVRAFQEHYGRTYEEDMSVDGIVGRQTWGGFFDLYMEQLQRLLGVDAAGLGRLRDGLAFVDDGKRALGCGEHHPIEAERVDAYRSAANRRVELLFFDPNEEPRLDCHPGAGACSPDVCELYNPRMYRFDHVRPSMDPFDLVVRVVPDPHLSPEHEDELVLESTDGSVAIRRRLVSDCVDCVEYLQLTFEQIDPALRYSLSIQCHDNLDPYYIFRDIRGLGLRGRIWQPRPPPEQEPEPEPEEDPSVVDDGMPPAGGI